MGAKALTRERPSDPNTFFGRGSSPKFQALASLLAIFNSSENSAAVPDALRPGKLAGGTDWAMVHGAYK